MVPTHLHGGPHSAPVGSTMFVPLLLLMTIALAAPLHAGAEDATSAAAAGIEVEINKKGLGKEVIIRKGSHEWYMLMEVTSDNTVIVRQHKDGDTYLVDESETHDRTFTADEVDSAINAFASSAKAQAAAQR